MHELVKPAGVDNIFQKSWRHGGGQGSKDRSRREAGLGWQELRVCGLQVASKGALEAVDDVCIPLPQGAALASCWAQQRQKLLQKGTPEQAEIGRAHV